MEKKLKRDETLFSFPDDKTAENGNSHHKTPSMMHGCWQALMKNKLSGIRFMKASPQSLFYSGTQISFILVPSPGVGAKTVE